MVFSAGTDVPLEAFTAPLSDREIQVRNCCAELLNTATKSSLGLAVVLGYQAEYQALVAAEPTEA